MSLKSFTATMLFVCLLCSSTATFSAKKSTTEEAIASLILVYGLDDFFKLLEDHLGDFTGKDFVVEVSKKILKHVVEKMLKSCSEESKCKEAIDKFQFKEKIFIRELGQSVVNDFAPKASIRASKLLKAAYLVGLSADVAQFVLEYYDYRMAGKIVGVVGNTVSGAMAGFALGGAPGMLVGGVMGLGLWVYTETELQHDFTELLSM